MNIRIRFALLELRHMVGIQSLVDINPYPYNFLQLHLYYFYPSEIERKLSYEYEQQTIG